MIADEIGKSRSSVDRDIRLLVNDGYINEKIKKYTLTQFGEYSLQIFRVARQLANIFSFVPYFPPDTPLELLENAEIREASGALPQRPLDHIANTIRRSKQVDIIAPVVLPPLTDVLVQEIQNGKLTADIIVSEEILEIFWETYPDEMRVYLESDGCTLWRTNEVQMFGLVIGEHDVMCLGIFDDSMRLLGTITNNSPNAVGWAVNAFNEKIDASTEVFARGPSPKMDFVLSNGFPV